MSETPHVNQQDPRAHERRLNQLWQSFPYLPRALAVSMKFSTVREEIASGMGEDPVEITLARLAELFKDQEGFDAYYEYPAGTLERVSDEVMHWSLTHPEEVPGEIMMEVAYGRVLEILGYKDGMSGAQDPAESPVPEEEIREKAKEDPADPDLIRASGIRTRLFEWQMPAYRFGHQAGTAARRLGGEMSDVVQELSTAFLKEVSLSGSTDEDLAHDITSGSLCDRVLNRAGFMFRSDLCTIEINTLVSYWAVREMRAASAEYVDSLLTREDPLSEAVALIRALTMETRRRESDTTPSQGLAHQSRMEAAMMEAINAGLGMAGAGMAALLVEDHGYMPVPAVVENLPDRTNLDESLAEAMESLGEMIPMSHDQEPLDLEEVLDAARDYLPVDSEDHPTWNNYLDAIDWVSRTHSAEVEQGDAARVVMDRLAWDEAASLVEDSRISHEEARNLVKDISREMRDLRGGGDSAAEIRYRYLKAMRSRLSVSFLLSLSDQSTRLSTLAEREVALGGGDGHIQYLVGRRAMLSRESRESRSLVTRCAHLALGDSIQERIWEDGADLFMAHLPPLMIDGYTLPGAHKGITDTGLRAYQACMAALEEGASGFGPDLLTMLKESVLAEMLYWIASEFMVIEKSRARAEA